MGPVNAGFALSAYYKHSHSTAMLLQIMHFVSNVEQKDTLKPLGFKNESAPVESATHASTTAVPATAAAAVGPPRKAKGRVIVIGAGPAGLAAANVLKVSKPTVIARTYI